MNGDPPTGYDIISWVWRGKNLSIREVGSFSPDPISLTVDADLIEWFDTGDSRPVRPIGVFLRRACITFVKLINWRLPD